MAKSKTSMRTSIKSARAMVKEILNEDANEAECRRRLERILTDVLAYDDFKDLSREKAIKGKGLDEFVDFAVKIDEDFKFFVELKRVKLTLRDSHVKQAAHYAIDSGLNWVILTNLVEWRIYHIEYGQPPITALLLSFNFLNDDIKELEGILSTLSRRSVKKGSLDELWVRSRSLSMDNLLRAFLSGDHLRAVRRTIRRETEALVSAEDIVASVRKMLNEKALKALDKIKISKLLNETKKTRKRTSRTIQQPKATESKEPISTTPSLDKLDD